MSSKPDSVIIAETFAVHYAETAAAKWVIRHGKTSHSAGEVADIIADRLLNKPETEGLTAAVISDICYDAAYAAGLNS